LIEERIARIKGLDYNRIAGRTRSILLSIQRTIDNTIERVRIQSIDVGIDKSNDGFPAFRKPIQDIDNTRTCARGVISHSQLR